MFVTILIYTLSVLPLVALMRIKQLPRYLCAFFITTLAEIILTGNILGLFHQLNNKTAWIVVQIVFLLISWALWLLFKPRNLFSIHFEKPNFHTLHFLQKFALILLCIVVVIGYVVLAYLILVVPPNNNDSMLVHLVRVGYWLQHGSFTPWNSIIERQVIYPYNAQIVLLWTILFQGSDLFAAFLQFFSVLFTALGIYCIGREIGGSRFQASMVALFYLTFPQVILQATTTQDDLVITCFLILGSYFFIRWYSQGYTQKFDLILACLSLMIALGIKPTAFYFFIGFAFFFLILLIIKKMKFKNLFQIGITCFFAFLIFSSYAYINNAIYFHNPLGPSDFVSAESGAFNGNIFRKSRVNTGRFLYEFISLDGLPTPIVQNIQNVKISIAIKLPFVFNTTTEFIKDPQKPFQVTTAPGINEDLSWFGPASFLLILPGFFIGIFKVFKSKDLKIFFFLIVPFFMMIGIGVLRPGWDPYQGRYFNPGIALMMPLVLFLINPKIGQQIYVLFISVLAVLITISSVLLNESKPIITQMTIYKNFTSTSCEENLTKKINCYLSSKLPQLLLNREDILSLNTLQKETYSSSSQYTILSQFDEEIPANSRIGLVLQNGDWEYPFFGRYFEYQLVPIINQKYLQDLSWLNQNRLDYIIINQKEGQKTIVDPCFKLQDQINGTWKIYKR